MQKVLYRALLFSCSVACLLGVNVAGAAAAGAPQIPAGPNWESGYGSLTSLVVGGYVTPNGASTSARFEVREVGSAEWTVLPKHEVGSGTSPVEVGERIYPLHPDADYELRITATNSYGSTSSSIQTYGGSRWWEQAVGSELTNVPYSSEGTAKFEFKWGNYLPIKVECHESGYGRIGNPSGSGDAHHFSLTGCKVYASGHESACKAGSTNFSLNGTLELEKLTQRIVIPLSGEGCNSENFEFSVSPFLLEQISHSTAEKDKMLLSTSGMMFGVEATVKFESTWLLSGEFAGRKFRLIDV